MIGAWVDEHYSKSEAQNISKIGQISNSCHPHTDLHIFTVTQSTLLTISVCHVQTSFCGRFSFSNMGCCHSYSWFYSPWDYSTGASKQGFPAVMWNMLMAPFHTCRLENKSRKSEAILAFKIPKRPYGSSPPPLQCALYAQFTKSLHDSK